MTSELKYLAARAATGKLDRRAFMGRAAALGLTGVMANSMLASTVLASSPNKGGFLKAGIQGGASSDSLDPALIASSAPGMVGVGFGEKLLDITPDGKIENRLAESVEASSDAKTWHFKMRKDVEFHNGKTVTPEDVLKTMQRHSGEESQSGALGIMRGIESMNVDGDVFSVTLTSPNADLPYLMTDYHLIIQPGGGMDAPAAGISAGPYVVETNEPGVSHKLKKFANYWDDGRGHADEIEIIVLNDSTTRTAALQSGQVHMINRVEPKVADLIGKMPGITVVNVSGRGHYGFYMHVDTAPFDNNDLRLALKYAVNRQEMVDKILRGYGGIGNDMPINASYPLASDSIPQRDYDPEKARHHLEKSGHSGPIILRVADAAFPGAVDAAQLYQQTAAAAGIELEIKREPNDGYWSEVWNKQPFSAAYWSGRPVQDQMYSTEYQSNADWNDTRFKNPHFDELLLSAKGELDTAKRKAIYHEMGLLVRDEGGAIIPMFNDFIDAVSDKVGGYVGDPNGSSMYDAALIKTWLL